MHARCLVWGSKIRARWCGRPCAAPCSALLAGKAGGVNSARAMICWSVGACYWMRFGRRGNAALYPWRAAWIFGSFAYAATLPWTQFGSSRCFCSVNSSSVRIPALRTGSSAESRVGSGAGRSLDDPRHPCRGQQVRHLADTTPVEIIAAQRLPGRGGRQPDPEDRLGVSSPQGFVAPPFRSVAVTPSEQGSSRLVGWSAIRCCRQVREPGKQVPGDKTSSQPPLRLALRPLGIDSECQKLPGTA
jgi:hypothetical protein